MNRIIINNKTDLSDSDIIAYVGYVIDQGKISKKDQQYCYCTTWPITRNGKQGRLIVYADKREKSDSFTIVIEKTLVSALEGAIDGWIRCYIAYDLEHDIGQKESFQNLQRKIDFKEAKQVLERYYRNQGQKKAARKDQ